MDFFLSLKTTFEQVMSLCSYFSKMPIGFMCFRDLLPSAGETGARVSHTHPEVKDHVSSYFHIYNQRSCISL